MGCNFRRSILILLVIWFSHLRAFVLINELYYDHPGSDSGYEWIELHNISNNPIDLENWKIQSAGYQFTDVFEFSDLVILGGEYLVVGESQVTSADIFADLNFQNGDGATDGVRLISGDSLWIDTILYDEPNSFGLPDDSGMPGTSFAPDAAAGCSLARYPNGLDTNSGADWKERQNPTPGSKNEGEIDLCFELAEIIQNVDEFYLYTILSNVSTESVYNSAGSIDIYLNNVPLSSFQIGSVSSGQVIEYEIPLPLFEAGYNMTELIINSIYDSNIGNNETGASILNGKSDILLNELMIRPAAGLSEWIEVIVNNSVDNFVNNLFIIDETGIPHAFNLNGSESGFYILGGNADNLEFEYDIPEELIITTDGFPALNNTGDTIKISDEWGTVFDSVTYSGSEIEEAGRSFERIDIDDQNSEWGLCIAPEGHTAVNVNSIAAVQYDLELEFLSHSSDVDGVYHTLNIKNNGRDEIEYCELEIIETDKVTYIERQYCRSFNLEGNLNEIIFASNSIDKGFYEYQYTVFAEEDSLLENNNAISYLNSGNLSWVINEIMYHPDSDEPEWVEIKRNLPEELPDELIFASGEDSTLIICSNEYFLVTGNDADRDFLKLKYGNSIEIHTGLGSLNNDGDHLFLGDIYENYFEEFTYETSWNFNQQNISIERINPQLPVSANNWGQSLEGCTPGRANSIYMENVPENKKLSISPEVFSPSQGESTLINYKSDLSNNRISVNIFDLKGRMIRNLADNEYSNMEMNIIWDGRDKSGRIARAGVYIILLECSNSNVNNKFKETVTVSW